MIKYDIKNRHTGAVQFTAEIDCDEEDLEGFKIGLAVIWAYINGTDLDNADLRGADLYGAELACLSLTNTDLRGANTQRKSRGKRSIGRTDIKQR